MSDPTFQDVWDALNVKDGGGMRWEFELNGEVFWIDRKNGLMRRLVAAERVLRSSITDPEGLAAGNHDEVIDHMMIIVSHRTKDDLHQFNSNWRDEIVSGFDEEYQLDFLQNLPYSVAAIILGESRAARVMGQGITLISPSFTKANDEE